MVDGKIHYSLQIDLQIQDALNQNLRKEEGPLKGRKGHPGQAHFLFLKGCGLESEGVWGRGWRTVVDRRLMCSRGA